MKCLSYSIILVFALCFYGHAQSNNGICPQIKLSVPHIIYPENVAKFSAQLERENDFSNLKYFWIISLPGIIKGGKTAQVEFTPEEGIENTNLGVAVKIDGLPKGCSDTVSETLIVGGLPIGDPVDSFGKIILNDYKARLDSLFTAIQNDPESEGMIVINLDKRSSAKFKRNRLNQTIKHIESRKFDRSRITFAITDYDYEQTVLWIIPLGAKFPEATPKSYKRISPTTHLILKAENIEQNISKISL